MDRFANERIPTARPEGSHDLRFASNRVQIYATWLNDVECHVWTAPAVQEENLTLPRSFGCSHVFGL
jgi:hypothetical protein